MMALSFIPIFFLRCVNCIKIPKAIPNAMSKEILKHKFLFDLGAFVSNSNFGARCGAPKMGSAGPATSIRSVSF